MLYGQAHGRKKWSSTNLPLVANVPLLCQPAIFGRATEDVAEAVLSKVGRKLDNE